MADTEFVVVGNDGIARIQRVALRSIPELLVGTDPDRFDHLASDARQEVIDFMSTHAEAIATSTVDQLASLVYSGLGLGTAAPLPDITDTMSDEEVLAAMEEGVDVAAAAADDLAGKQAIVAKAISTTQGIARGALMAGMAALTAALA